MSNESINETVEKVKVPAFGYELLREVLLPEVFGKDHAQLMYWSGKQLARKFPLSTIDEIISFFDEAGWGNLHIQDEKKYEMTFVLEGGYVARRCDVNKDASFQLEAGFIAEQIQRMKDKTTEAIEEIKKKNKRVITVQWDK
ncbi:MULTISPECIES: YslB family protein [Bacillus]|uniref:YslB family protein n=1 Tax=Bacillus TaxID=1386 RepID=UPI000BB8C6F8|nr:MULTISPECIES: YslB family protein [Bacillus]